MVYNCLLHTIIGGSCHKYHFCRDRHVFVVTNIILSRHKFCRDKHTFMFVATSILLLCLSRQAYFCYVCRDRYLSRRMFYCDKMFLWRQKFCHDKYDFVATKDLFCRDKHCLVATKMRLAATPAKDNVPHPSTEKVQKHAYLLGHKQTICKFSG